MSRVSPFRGSLFDLDRVGALEDVTSPPYDTITDEEQGRYRSASPYNVVHLEFNERGAGSFDRAAQYTQAASLLRRWHRDGALVEDAEPAYYPYEMRFEYEGSPRRIRGLLCVVDLEPWGGSVIPHERTMEGQVEDRLGLMRAVAANLSPVYSMFAGPEPELAALLETITSQAPLRALTDEAGVEHRMWRVGDEGVARWLSDDDGLSAAGQHRYAVALRYKAERDVADGAGPWDSVMMFIVDATSEVPPVLPIHRIFYGAAPPEEGEQVRGLDELLASLDDDRPTYGTTVGSADGISYHVARLPGDPPTVQALHRLVLDGLSEDGDLRYVADPAAAEAAVRSGEATAAFFLPATTPSRIWSVIHRGERLPQKSTFF